MNDERLPGKIYDGFKVVYSLRGLIHSDILGSCCADNNRVVYDINRWVFPMVGAGPLAVFRQELDARVFASNNRLWMAIYKCKYRKSKFNQLWYNMASTHRTYKPENELPQGTDFADAVMITEEVK
jgi:hypothetical protein